MPDLASLADSRGRAFIFILPECVDDHAHGGHVIVRLTDFSSLLQITFSLNAVTSYLTLTRQKALASFEKGVQDILDEYPAVPTADPISKLRINISKHISVLTNVGLMLNYSGILLSLGSLLLLVTASFSPVSTVYRPLMFAFVILSLLIPLLSYYAVPLIAATYVTKVRRQASELSRRFELAGYHKCGAIRISKLAEHWRAGTSLSPPGLSLTFWLLKVLGCKHSVELDQEMLDMAEEIGSITGGDLLDVTAGALGLMELMVENKDGYLVARSPNGTEELIPIAELLENPNMFLSRNGKRED